MTVLSTLVLIQFWLGLFEAKATLGLERQGSSLMERGYACSSLSLRPSCLTMLNTLFPFGSNLIVSGGAVKPA
jgi:hypothetical protein